MAQFNSKKIMLVGLKGDAFDYTVPVVDSPPTAHLPTEQGQMYMEARTNKVYIAVEDYGGTPEWKEIPFSESIDGKLDKVSTTSEVNRLYGIRTSGEQNVFTASYKPISYAIPMYDTSGTLRASSPTENTHCANKQYVDALKQSTNPNTSATAGHIGQLCLVGSSDSSPYEVYICVYSDTANNQYVWHKMCTTEAPL